MRHVLIESGHRIQAKEHPRPVIVTFSFFKDKEKVLKRYREKRKKLALKETGEAQRDATEGED